MRNYLPPRCTRTSISKTSKRRTTSFTPATAWGRTGSSELEGFLRHIRLTRALDTYKNKRWQLMPFMRWMAGEKRRYDELQGSDIETYLRELDCCRAHMVNVAATIRQFYEYQNVQPNPAAFLQVKNGRSRRLHNLPGTARIATAIDAIHCGDPLVELRDRIMVELAYGSGLRRGELLRLNIEDVQLGEQTAYVQGKGGACRTVPLTGIACGLLKDYLSIRKDMTGPMFTSVQSGRRLSQNHISKLFKRRTGFKTHLYRHACATHLLQNGCNLRYVQELLGHRKINTTGIYTHLKTGDLRQSVATAHPRSRKVDERAA